MKYFALVALSAFLAEPSHAAAPLIPGTLFGPVSDAWHATLAPARLDPASGMKALVPANAPMSVHALNDWAISWILETKLNLQPQDLKSMSVAQRNHTLNLATFHARNRVNEHVDDLLSQAHDLMVSDGASSPDQLDRMGDVITGLGRVHLLSHLFDRTRGDLKEEVPAVGEYLTDLHVIRRERLEGTSKPAASGPESVRRPVKNGRNAVPAKYLELITAVAGELDKPDGRLDYYLDMLAQFAVECPVYAIKVDALRVLFLTAMPDAASIGLRISLMEAVGRSSKYSSVKKLAFHYIAALDSSDASPEPLYRGAYGGSKLKLLTVSEQKQRALSELARDY